MLKMSKFSIKLTLFLISVFSFALVFASSCSSNINNSNSDNQNYNKLYDVEFHRGGRDARPENTLYSYTYALEQGATTIEGDMQMTKDGVIVMSHNPMLNCDITKDANGNYVQKNTIDIRTSTYDEIKNYNVGEMKKDTEYYELHGKTQKTASAQIPKLEELFELVKESGNDKIMFNLEIKSYPDPATGLYHKNNVDIDKFLNEFNRIVKKYNVEDRMILQSFDWKPLVMMKDINSKIKTSALYSEDKDEEQGIGTLWLSVKEASPWLAGKNIHDYNDDAVAVAHDLGIDIVSPQWDQIEKWQVDEAHKWNIKIVSWTVNTKENMEKTFDMGVDGIISDKGELLWDFVKSKNLDVAYKTQIDNAYHLD